MFSSLLAGSFILFNTLRVLFYLPQIGKLVKARNNLATHSLFTWFSWVFANLTTGLLFYQQSNRLDDKVLLNMASAFMCAVVVGIILYKRNRYPAVEEGHLALA